MKKSFCTFAIFAFLFVTQSHAFHWDNEHFVDYTSNAIANAGLISFGTMAYLHGFDHRKSNIDSYYNNEPHPKTAYLALTLTLASLGILCAKCAYAKKANRSIIKRFVNNCIDIPFLLAPFINFYTQNHISLSYCLPIVYLAKYTIFNRPNKEETQKDNDKIST